MQAISAKKIPHRISLIVYDNVKLLDVTGPLQVFSDARFKDGSAAYQINILSVDGRPVSTDTMLPLNTISSANAHKADTIIVAGGRGALSIRYSPELQALIKDVCSTAKRVCSVCLGAFILAEAGLLDGKRATTHWMESQRLAHDYPDVTVIGDEIFEKSNSTWTSAGVSAGIDMSLALVEEDLGRKEALRIARLLVLPIKRQGGQSQFSVGLRQQCDSTTGKFDALLTAIQDQPGDTYTVPLMAARTHMSERNFSRLFKAEVGDTPAQFVEKVRVEATRDALLDQTMSLKEAAFHFGFASEENMRRAFKRQFGVTPSDILEQFLSN